MNKILYHDFGIDDATHEQLQRLQNDKAYKDCTLAVMPDCHAGAGKGTPCGIVLKGSGALNPSLVGNDIGCGVMAVPVELENFMNLSSFYKRLDRIIQCNIPSGFAINKDSDLKYMNPNLEMECMKILDSKGFLCDKNVMTMRQSMGSLGGGNHFIELDYSKSSGWWLIIHTGSRGFGSLIASFWEDYAKRCGDEDVNHKLFLKDIKDILIKWMKENYDTRKHINDMLKHFNNISELVESEYVTPLISGCHAMEYLYDSEVCMRYAKANRMIIARTIIDNIGGDMTFDWRRKVIDSVHNYVDGDFSSWTIRKSAIDASEMKDVIIPLNMADGSIIGRGLGNKDWLNSAPHGAGRQMSRTDAKKILSVDCFRDDMHDVFSSSVNDSTLDEAPAAYKNSESIIKSIDNTTVMVVDRLGSRYNFKAGVHDEED